MKRVATEGSSESGPPTKRRSRWGDTSATKDDGDDIKSRIKAKLAAMQSGISTGAQAAPSVAPLPSTTNVAIKEKQASILQARIQARLQRISTQDKGKSVSSNAPQAPAAAQIAATDTIIAGHGQGSKGLLDIPVVPVATAKANLKVLQPKQEEKEESQLSKGEDALPRRDYFDPRLRVGRSRQKRATFSFVTEGAYIRKGDKLREKAFQEQAQADMALKGQSRDSASSVAREIPKRKLEVMPAIEWWDAVLLQDTPTDEGLLSIWIASEPSFEDFAGATKLKDDRISQYVEHPIMLDPPGTGGVDETLPIMLTKKERKKVNRMRRLEREKEKQELMQLGILKQENKLKLSNFMKSMNAQATSDPTKLEAEVRKQMAEREAAHNARNAERKLTPEERREKERKKFQNDSQTEVHVALYAVDDLSHPQNIFKVDKNAQELYMTGCALLLQNGRSAVIAEGSQRSQKRYQKLMLRRIDWDKKKLQDEDKDDEKRAVEKVDEGQSKKKCSLVWEGIAKRPAFKSFRVEKCESYGSARVFLRVRGVEHYLDMLLKGESAD
uniref:Uncharacterized protein n=1 Tax=Palpitomonas bilix TaxID=652834 RepID=A0A7S3G8T8_9EUKA|mmetsp:Transcript_31159/g.81756  ORF Transcript_31159/g.81756 Transcript_31159/m.81756 type:complete len:556 (+) Transcript_31159:81-1748(+)